MNLANKYRPSKFNEVIGQDNIVTIINNQLQQGKHKQAYLLVGPAGTGKTTNARIIAKELNEGREGIIEIDGASNNGVENVRELIENSYFKPINSKYKIFIIDEVNNCGASLI